MIADLDKASRDLMVVLPEPDSLANSIIQGSVADVISVEDTSRQRC
jgi:hypothetical protein